MDTQLLMDTQNTFCEQSEVLEFKCFMQATKTVQSSVSKDSLVKHS